LGPLPKEGLLPAEGAGSRPASSRARGDPAGHAAAPGAPAWDTIELEPAAKPAPRSPLLERGDARLAGAFTARSQGPDARAPADSPAASPAAAEPGAGALAAVAGAGRALWAAAVGRRRADRAGAGGAAAGDGGGAGAGAGEGALAQGLRRSGELVPKVRSVQQARPLRRLLCTRSGSAGR
jgi:hypothetical protein